MSVKKPAPVNEVEYVTTVVEEQVVTTISVNWKDGETLIVGGEKKIVGPPEQAQNVAKIFAEDLKKNFAKRFPAVEPEESELI